MEYNRYTRIRANRNRKLKNVALFAIIATLFIYIGHMDYQDQQLEQGVLTYK